MTKEFDKRLSLCCDRMTNAWDEREKMMNGIVARIVHFQVGSCSRVVCAFIRSKVGTASHPTRIGLR